MSCSSDASRPTLWDLAEIVLEETERCCIDERLIKEVSDRVLVRFIREHVRNMSVVSPDPFSNARIKP